MTYMARILVHMVDHVDQWRPLWGFSVFPFESMNGRLASLVNGTRENRGVLDYPARMSPNAFVEPRWNTTRVYDKQDCVDPEVASGPVKPQAALATCDERGENEAYRYQSGNGSTDRSQNGDDREPVPVDDRRQEYLSPRPAREPRSARTTSSNR
ncbi:hypothetical protein HPB49_003177 [Dermacentor silvarum]|uniref:Uncharacterized protein n=1 Tax=Dermacentor silvarum TaxID=543639 RepID=A0ACB8D2I5_DERSI|nr:hypothetical protein HPB49_003177 [Dermacentor silvarum]